MNKVDKLRELFTKNGLDKEDIFKLKLGGREVPIITRTGIEKIQAKNKILVKYKLMKISDDQKFVVIKAFATMGDVYIETFGEASPTNARQVYPVAMAEKRALSRAVLKIAGLYELGVFGEDESDDFKNNNKE